MRFFICAVQQIGEIFKASKAFFYVELVSCPQEKQDLLRQWVTSGENLNSVETNLEVSRTQEGELNRDHELLTIAEMRSPELQ